MNFLALVKELARMAGMVGEDGPPIIGGQTGEYRRAIEYVRIAHEDVNNLYFDWDFLWAHTTLATESGMATYAGPADLGIWDAQRLYLDGQPIEVIEWADHTPDTGSNARPHTAVIRPDNQLQLVPAPDGEYTLSFDYFKASPVLENDADEPLIPARFRRVILGRALMLYGNYEAADDAKTQGAELYQLYLEQLERHQLSRRQQTHGRAKAKPINVVAE